MAINFRRDSKKARDQWRILGRSYTKPYKPLQPKPTTPEQPSKPKGTSIGRVTKKRAATPKNYPKVRNKNANPFTGGRTLGERAAQYKKSPKGKMALARVRSQRSSGTTSPRAATRPAARSGGGGGGVRQTRAQRNRAAAGRRAGAGTRAQDTAQQTTQETSGWDTEMAPYFNAARREIERQRQINEATRLARLEDQRAFDEWVATRRGAHNETLRQAFERTAADAQAARQASLDMINKYAVNAMQQAGGDTGALQQAGTNANLEAFGYLSAADAADSAGGAFNQAALTQRQAAMEEADRARAANMVASYNAQARAANEQLNQAAQKLSMDEIKARADYKAAERQFILDQQAADFLNSLKQGELEVKRANAVTARLRVKLNAQQQARALELRRQIAAGNMSIREADLAIRRERLSLDKRKAMREIVMGGGNAQKIRQDASKFITQWHQDQLERLGRDDIGTGQPAIDYGRTAVAKLRGFAPTLRAEQAAAILRGILPWHVMKDNRIKVAIAQAFR